MQSQESIPDQDREGGTRNETRDAAGVVDPPIINPPVASNPVDTTSLQAGPVLVHLSLDEWKLTQAFQDLQRQVEAFFRPNVISQETSLSMPVVNAIKASLEHTFCPINQDHRFPYWVIEHRVENMVGVLTNNHRVTAIYHNRLREELYTMGTRAGVPDVQARASSILRDSYGPDRPDIVCSAASLPDMKDIWTYIQEHKIGNQTEGLAQLLWYLAIANHSVGCHLGSLLVINKLQRVVMVGEEVFIETTEAAADRAALTPMEDFEALFNRITEDCPMPFRLFESSQAADGRIRATSNDDGLRAFLKITGRASELAAQIGLDKLQSVPSAESTISLECLRAQDRLPFQLSPEPDLALRSLLTHTSAFRGSLARYRKILGPSDPSEPKTEKRRGRDDDSDDERGDTDYKYPHKLPKGTTATRTSQRDRGPVDYTAQESSESSSDLDSPQKLLSASNLAKTPSACDMPIKRFLEQRTEDIVLMGHEEAQTLSISSEDEGGQLGPDDSATCCSASSEASTHWSDQFRDRKAILPSRVVGVLQAMGLRPVLVTTHQLDRLIDSAPERTTVDAKQTLRNLDTVGRPGYSWSSGFTHALPEFVTH